MPLPLYRYGWVQRGLVSIPTAKYYALDKGEKDPTPVLQATERFNLNPFKCVRVTFNPPPALPLLSSSLTRDACSNPVVAAGRS